MLQGQQYGFLKITLSAELVEGSVLCLSRVTTKAIMHQLSSTRYLH